MQKKKKGSFWAILLASKVIISQLLNLYDYCCWIDLSVLPVCIAMDVKEVGGRPVLARAILQFPATILGCSAGGYIWYCSSAWKHLKQACKPQWNPFSFIISNFLLPPYPVSLLPSLCLVVVFQVNVIQGRQTAQKGLNGGRKSDVVTSQSSYSSSLSSAEWLSNANHVPKSPLHQVKYLKCCEAVH